MSGKLTTDEKIAAAIEIRDAYRPIPHFFIKDILGAKTWPMQDEIVKSVLWREFATAVRLSKLKLTDNEVRQTGLDIDKDWYAVGLSTKQPENFFGYHSAHILV